MPLFFKNSKTILFVHIPKTGGTSVCQFFRANGFNVRWQQEQFDVIKKISSPQHRTRDQIIECLSKESIKYDYSFAMVREPLDRLLSEYFFQCWLPSPLNRKLTFNGRAFSKYIRWSFFNMKVSSWAFSYWVDRVFEMNAENPVYFDNHIRPQSEFLLKDTRVFRFEDGFDKLLDYFNELDLKHQFQMDFNKLKRSNKGRNKVPIEIPKRTLKKISMFYKEDYEMFYSADGKNFPLEKS